MQPGCVGLQPECAGAQSTCTGLHAQVYMRRSAVCIGLQRAHLIGAERRAVEWSRLAALLH